MAAISPASIGGHFDLSSASLSSPVCGIGQSRQKSAQHIEAGSGNTAARARMHALGEHVDLERAHDVSAQRGGEPQPLVVAGLGIQTDHEARAPDVGGERLDVRRQIDAAALLARLDQEHAARMRNFLRLEGGDGRERGENRVAVVRRTAAVEPPVANHRLPGTEPVLPAGEFRLLVEVAVEQDGLACLGPAPR